MKGKKTTFWVGLTFAIGAILSARGLWHRESSTVAEPAPHRHERSATPNVIPAIERTPQVPPAQMVTASAGQEGEAFSALMEKSWEILPKMENLRGRTDAEVHGAPPEIIKSAEALGKIVTRLRANPQLIPKGVEFLRACAGREELVDTVRVLCYRDLKFWSARANPPMEAQISGFPNDLQRRAELLPALR